MRFTDYSLSSKLIGGKNFRTKKIINGLGFFGGGDQSSVCGCRWMNFLVVSVCSILDSFIFIFWKCCQSIPVSTGIAVVKENDQRKD